MDKLKIKELEKLLSQRKKLHNGMEVLGDVIGGLRQGKIVVNQDRGRTSTFIFEHYIAGIMYKSLSDEVIKIESWLADM